MGTLIILAILGLASGGWSVYVDRKREKADYEEYMAKRIAFDVSERNSDK